MFKHLDEIVEIILDSFSQIIKDENEECFSIMENPESLIPVGLQDMLKFVKYYMILYGTGITVLTPPKQRPKWYQKHVEMFSTWILTDFGHAFNSIFVNTLRRLKRVDETDGSVYQFPSIFFYDLFMSREQIKEFSKYFTLFVDMEKNVLSDPYVFELVKYQLKQDLAYHEQHYLEDE